MSKKNFKEIAVSTGLSVGLLAGSLQAEAEIPGFGSGGPIDSFNSIAGLLGSNIFNSMMLDLSYMTPIVFSGPATSLLTSFAPTWFPYSPSIIIPTSLIMPPIASFPSLFGFFAGNALNAPFSSMGLGSVMPINMALATVAESFVGKPMVATFSPLASVFFNEFFIPFSPSIGAVASIFNSFMSLNNSIVASILPAVASLTSVALPSYVASLPFSSLISSLAVPSASIPFNAGGGAAGAAAAGATQLAANPNFMNALNNMAAPKATTGIINNLGLKKPLPALTFQGPKLPKLFDLENLSKSVNKQIDNFFLK